VLQAEANLARAEEGRRAPLTHFFSSSSSTSRAGQRCEALRNSYRRPRRPRRPPRAGRGSTRRAPPPPVSPSLLPNRHPTNADEQRAAHRAASGAHSRSCAANARSTQLTGSSAPGPRASHLAARRRSKPRMPSGSNRARQLRRPEVTPPAARPVSPGHTGPARSLRAKPGKPRVQLGRAVKAIRRSRTRLGTAQLQENAACAMRPSPQAAVCACSRRAGAVLPDFRVESLPRPRPDRQRAYSLLPDGKTPSGTTSRVRAQRVPGGAFDSAPGQRSEAPPCARALPRSSQSLRAMTVPSGAPAVNPWPIAMKPDLPGATFMEVPRNPPQPANRPTSSRWGRNNRGISRRRFDESIVSSWTVVFLVSNAVVLAGEAPGFRRSHRDRQAAFLHAALRCFPPCPSVSRAGFWRRA